MDLGDTYYWTWRKKPDIRSLVLAIVEMNGIAVAAERSHLVKDYKVATNLLFFNDASKNQYETFDFPGKTVPDGFNFCKTGSTPYSKVVKACLLAAAETFPPAILEISSDGDYPEEWRDGIEYFRAVLGRDPPNLMQNDEAVLVPVSDGSEDDPNYEPQRNPKKGRRCRICHGRGLVGGGWDVPRRRCPGKTHPWNRLGYTKKDRRRKTKTRSPRRRNPVIHIPLIVLLEEKDLNDEEVQERLVQLAIGNVIGVVGEDVRVVQTGPHKWKILSQQKIGEARIENPASGSGFPIGTIIDFNSEESGLNQRRSGIVKAHDGGRYTIETNYGRPGQSFFLKAMPKSQTIVIPDSRVVGAAKDESGNPVMLGAEYIIFTDGGQGRVVGVQGVRDSSIEYASSAILRGTRGNDDAGMSVRGRLIPSKTSWLKPLPKGNPHRPTREFWRKHYPGVVKGIRAAHPEWTRETAEQRAKETMGAIWFHKMSPAKRKEYERIVAARERPKSNPPKLYRVRVRYPDSEVYDSVLNAATKADARCLAVAFAHETGGRLARVKRMGKAEAEGMPKAMLTGGSGVADMVPGYLENPRRRNDPTLALAGGLGLAGGYVVGDAVGKRGGIRQIARDARARVGARGSNPLPLVPLAGQAAAAAAGTAAGAHLVRNPPQLSHTQLEKMMVEDPDQYAAHRRRIGNRSTTQPSLNANSTNSSRRANRQLCPKCKVDIVYVGRATNPRKPKDLFMLYRCEKCKSHFRLDK